VEAITIELLLIEIQQQMSTNLYHINLNSRHPLLKALFMIDFMEEIKGPEVIQELKYKKSLNLKSNKKNRICR
jgi:hypothetical protein